MRPIVRERILRKYDYQCCQCSSKEKLHIDHIIPLCRGGSDNEDNKQVLCRTCNLKKGRSVNFDQYFKIGLNPEYILLSVDFINIIGNTPKHEIPYIIENMFKKNTEVFK